jgi:glycosyltransferase involved in cell wall biosynthesis
MKILCLFDYNTTTGFATVSKNLVKNWVKTFGNEIKLHIIASNYFGSDYSESENIRVISGKLNDVAQDDYGRYAFLKQLKENDYDLIFIIQDLGIVVPMIPYIKDIKEMKAVENRPSFKSMYYFPVDFALTPNLGLNLEFFDFLSTYTEYGKEQITRLRPYLKTKVKVIPHGNSMAEFYPLEEEVINKFRKEYFGENADKFIISNINRNQERKDIPTTIFGFIEYKNEYNDKSFLYLHMNPTDPNGWKLKTLLAQTPLIEGKDYMFPSVEDYTKGASVEKLNLIYNASDVYLTTANGGGWELPVTEAMGCLVPTIVPKHTSLSELAGANGERAYLLQTLYPSVPITDSSIRWQSDYIEIADVLNDVFKDIKNNSPILQNKVNEAYKFVKGLDWKSISERFSEEIKRLS